MESMQFYCISVSCGCFSLALADLELVRLQLNQEQGEVANRTRKCRKLERANESLREELKNVREQVIKKKSFSTVEMGTYKDMEDKVVQISTSKQLNILMDCPGQERLEQEAARDELQSREASKPLINTYVHVDKMGNRQLVTNIIVHTSLVGCPLILITSGHNN